MVKPLRLSTGKALSSLHDLNTYFTFFFISIDSDLEEMTADHETRLTVTEENIEGNSD